jgi:hypothetical protein
MTWKTKVFDFKFSRISFSVHEVRVSFFTTWANDFAMINFDDFITHTFRDRKNVLSFSWIMIEANLIFSSIHSANSVRNEFHRSSFNSSSYSCILFSNMWVLDSYFSFDFSAFSVCSMLFVDFLLFRIEIRFRLANDDSKVICRLAERCRLVKMNAK